MTTASTESKAPAKTASPTQTKAQLAERVQKAEAAQKEADAAAKANERSQAIGDTANPAIGLQVAPVTTEEGQTTPTVREPMATLPKDHTYRDRVVAQADSLGIATNDEMTLEFIMWLIRMKASS